MILLLMKQEVKCTGVILLNSITAGRIMRNEIQMLILFSWSLKISYRKSIFWIYDSENFFVLLSDKSKAVQQIAEFLELKDFNVESIVSNSSIDATRDRRQKIYERKMLFSIILLNQFWIGYSKLLYIMLMTSWYWLQFSLGFKHWSQNLDAHITCH